MRQAPEFMASRLLKKSIENASRETKDQILLHLRKNRIVFEFYTKRNYANGRSKSFFSSLLARFIQRRPDDEVANVA